MVFTSVINKGLDKVSWLLPSGPIQINVSQVALVDSTKFSPSQIGPFVIRVGASAVEWIVTFTKAGSGSYRCRRFCDRLHAVSGIPGAFEFGKNSSFG